VLAERRTADFLYVIDVCFCSPVFATMFVNSAKAEVVQSGRFICRVCVQDYCKSNQSMSLKLGVRPILELPVRRTD